jgi:hypothetical protein
MKFLLSLLLAACWLLPASAFAQDDETWSAHAQSTYVRQVQPAFRSPYAGPLALQGTRWSRAKDTVGLALGADAISAAHRTCLERGGLTSFLRDGTLRDPRERVAELSDSADLGAGFALTADAQRVANPGYNQDRGPASFHALRLHWEV